MYNQFCKYILILWRMDKMDTLTAEHILQSIAIAKIFCVVGIGFAIFTLILMLFFTCINYVRCNKKQQKRSI